MRFHSGEQGECHPAYDSVGRAFGVVIEWTCFSFRCRTAQLREVLPETALLGGRAPGTRSCSHRKRDGDAVAAPYFLR